MLSAPYASILEAEGFRPIGELCHRVRLTAWWNPAPDKRLQVLVLPVGRSALIKADKAYCIKSVTAEGETWARDIGLLHDWLEGHFPEVRIAFSHFRDVPAELARAEVARRTAIAAPTQPLPTVEQVGALQRRLDAERREASATEGLMSLSSVGSDLLTGYLHHQARSRNARINELTEQVERQRERLELFQHLQHEYQRKGSAAVYSFSISSNLQVAGEPARFRDCLYTVVKELQDAHRYQVMQKLAGGRLNIQVAEAQQPAITWIEQWLGGALTPALLRRLGPEFEILRTAAEERVVVTPDEPIVVNGGAVRHAEKRLAARVVSDVLRRIDKTDVSGHKADLSPDDTPAEAMPLNLGFRIDENERRAGSLVFPLTQMVHVYVSGTTGSGKSFLARVLVEEAAEQKGLSVLVLDPRNQAVGLLVPEDRPKILDKYHEFGMRPDRARGFAFDYFAPGLPYARTLPDDLPSLARGRSIVSFKGLDDQRRCAIAGKILDAAFEACHTQESERPRLLVVVDEAQLFTRRRLDESAKAAAAQVERALDRIAREGRKFGLVLVLVSQTMKDFSYELASIRQMTTTKIFLRNSDREIEYAADIIGDGRLLVQLPTAAALVHNANWGVVRVRVRPPYSKVFELGDADVRQLLAQDRNRLRTISAEAQRLYAVVREHGPQPDQPLNMSRAAELAGISSKRRLLDLIGELEGAGMVQTMKLAQRGSPRVIRLVNPGRC